MLCVSGLAVVHAQCLSEESSATVHSTFGDVSHVATRLRLVLEIGIGNCVVFHTETLHSGSIPVHHSM